MILAFLLSVAAQSPAAPPPIVATPVPAPPIVITPTAPPPFPMALVPLTLSAGDPGKEILYQGTLRTAPSATARFSQNKNEIAARPCENVTSYLSSENSSFSIQLATMDSSENWVRVNVAVDWTRMVPTADCGPGTSRTVRVSQTLKMEPGQTYTLTGDAGLTVRLTRR